MRGDHVGSDEFFPASVGIIAHENASASMAKMPAFADPAKKSALPDKTYSDRMTVLDRAEAIDLYHFGAAHTNGDSFVVSRTLRVMHSGDAFAPKGAPFIDRSNGGNGAAYPETLAKAAAGITDVDTVIPGHSAVTTWAAFLEYGEFMRAVVDETKKAKQAGKTADQAAAELKLPAKFQGYAMNRAKDAVTAMYADLP